MGLDYQYNRNNYRILIRILHLFLNRSINIIMDHYYKGNLMGSLIQEMIKMPNKTFTGPHILCLKKKQNMRASQKFYNNLLT